MTGKALHASPSHIQLHFFSVIPPVICVETAKVFLPQPLVTVNQKQNGFRLRTSVDLSLGTSVAAVFLRA